MFQLKSIQAKRIKILTHKTNASKIPNRTWKSKDT